MRTVAVLLVALVCAVPARADGERLDWPLRPRPAVVRGFDAPSPDWNRGHRGVDLSGAPGQPVYAAGSATVVYAGLLAGRPVISLAHPGGLRTSYEPVRASVRVGQLVTAGSVIGELVAGHPGCTAAACLHWGAMWGPAAAAEYVDPLGLLKSTPVRLKPLGLVRIASRKPCGGLGCGWNPHHGDSEPVFHVSPRVSGRQWALGDSWMGDDPEEGTESEFASKSRMVDYTC